MEAEGGGSVKAFPQYHFAAKSAQKLLRNGMFPRHHSEEEELE